MDPLAITAEIFVLTITGAIFGGMAMLIALDILADRTALKNSAIKVAVVNTTVQQIRSHVAQPASNSAEMPKAA